MSVQLIDGYDDGLFPSKWTFANVATVTAGTSRTGTSKLDLSTSTRHVYKELPTPHATVVFGSGVYFTSLTSAPSLLYFLSDTGATSHINIRILTSGGFEIKRGSTVIGNTATGLILVNNWYHLEVKVFLNDATGTVEIRLNNTVIFTFVGDTKNGGTEAVISRVRIGDTSTGSVNVNLDDTYILNGAGTSNNNFIGDSRIHNLLPDANGNYSQWVGSDADSVNNYLLVDETPPNTTDYVGSGTSGNKDSYNFPSVPAAVTLIRAVGQRAYAATSDAGPRAARNLVRIGGVDYVGADYNLGTTYLLYETLYDVSPATTIAFTPAEFNAAEWGIECRA